MVRHSITYLSIGNLCCFPLALLVLFTFTNVDYYPSYFILRTKWSHHWLKTDTLILLWQLSHDIANLNRSMEQNQSVTDNYSNCPTPGPDSAAVFMQVG